jgi:glutamate--cysteine ligase
MRRESLESRGFFGMRDGTVSGQVQASHGDPYLQLDAPAFSGGQKGVCERLWTRKIELSQSPLDQKPLRMGVELEVFPLHSLSLEPLGLDGAEGLTSASLLERVAANVGDAAELIRDGDVVYGLVIPLSGAELRFSLEPGGQLEVATPPRESVADIGEDLARAFSLIERAAEGHVKFLSHGTHPLCREDFPLQVPKRRYRIMTRYFQSQPQGRGIDMMRLTGTVQPNLDVGPLVSDWRDAVRLSYALSPVLKRLFAHAYFFQKKFCPDGLERQRIWEGLDPSRSGVPAGIEHAENPACCYAAWAEQAYVFHIESLAEEDQPLYGELRFCEWLEKGFKGTRPTLADWEAHLATLFPEVRLRGFLEVRMLDAQSFDRILPVLALLKGCLQSRIGRQASWRVLEEYRKIMQRHEADPFEVWPLLVAAAGEGLQEMGDCGSLKLLDQLEPPDPRQFGIFENAEQYVKMHATRWPSSVFRQCLETLGRAFGEEPESGRESRSH